MAAPIICWLPGWASDFSLWRDEIHIRAPLAKHRFVPYSRMLQYRENLETLPELQGADQVIAWSLGSLLALQNLPKLPMGLNLTALCPIASFCQPLLGWSPRVLQRMTNKLHQDPQSVISAFADGMGPAAQSAKASWVALALQTPLSDLVLGLELLATQQVPNLATLAQSHSIRLYAGEADTVVSPALATWLAQNLKPTSFTLVPHMSHWPFSGEWPI